MKELLLIVVILNFLSFFFSVIILFKKNEEMNFFLYRLLQIGSLLYWMLSLYLLQRGEFSGPTVSSVIIIQVFCLFSFWWNSHLVKKNALTIAFSKNAPERLVSDGYYKWVRHPYYAVYLLCYLSVALIVENLFLWASYIGMVLIYWKAAKFEEEKFSNSSLSQEYEIYKSRTWMFFPKIF